MKYILAALLFFSLLSARAQQQVISGAIAGEVVASVTGKPVEGATIIVRLQDENDSVTAITGDDGGFLIRVTRAGVYRLDVTAINFAAFSLDSIHVRQERQSFRLPTISLLPSSAGLSTVVVYAEKPLYENKDGKLTFNAGESALSEGSSATDLLKQTPLITVDDDGKVLMKGKEVKILVDDKPVNMDAAQLQSMLESMPGSMIDKIEVLTTPPPQYATERGGVLNIVTKKGKAGNSGRVALSYGSRGEASVSGGYTVRKKKLTLNTTAGLSYGAYNSARVSLRQNIYKDSTNFFNTYSDVTNERWRPYLKISADYSLSALQAISFSGALNGNRNQGNNFTRYQNLDSRQQMYKHSTRDIGNDASLYGHSLNVAYQKKWKDAYRLFRTDVLYTRSDNTSDRNFYQAFLAADSTALGIDSTQVQNSDLETHTMAMNVNYDHPVIKNKLLLNAGGSGSMSGSKNDFLTSFLLKPANVFVPNDLLSNHFTYHEQIWSGRTSLRYQVKEGFFGYAGLQVDHTNMYFRIVNDNNNYRNNYFSYLPFANITYRWESGFSLTGNFKRSITRPGINQLNPSIDYSDPYNTRFGNPYLLPYMSDNTDVTAGFWNKKFSLNLSAGYNMLTHVYSTLRTLQADGKTATTWQNLGGRKEYECTLWGNYNPGKKIKLTASAGYTYNVYSSDSKTLRKYQDGGSLLSSFNGSFVMDKLTNFNATVQYNRLANPQGSVRTAVNTSFAAQRKMMNRLLNVTLQMTDPWGSQKLYSFINASNYNLQSWSLNNTQNFKLSLSYTIKKKPAKKPVKKK